MYPEAGGGRDGIRREAEARVACDDASDAELDEFRVQSLLEPKQNRQTGWDSPISRSHRE